MCARLRTSKALFRPRCRAYFGSPGGASTESKPMASSRFGMRTFWRRVLALQSIKIRQIYCFTGQCVRRIWAKRDLAVRHVRMADLDLLGLRPRIALKFIQVLRRDRRHSRLIGDLDRRRKSGFIEAAVPGPGRFALFVRTRDPDAVAAIAAWAEKHHVRIGFPD